MINSKWKLYNLLLASCIIGYCWVFYVMRQQGLQTSSFTPCLIKNVISFPCPSCGSTRAVILLLQGEILESLYTNPLGLLITIVLVISPLWIVVDILRNSNSFFHFYNLIEKEMIKRKISIMLVFLILLNWIWNIFKGV